MSHGPGTARFPRSARLATQADFRQVFSRAVRSADGCLTVLATPNSINHGRLGLAIAKRAVPRAVDRNRLKRLVRESFREHQAQLVGLDIVVLARPGAGSRDNRELRATLAHHWRRLIKRCAKS